MRYTTSSLLTGMLLFSTLGFLPVSCSKSVDEDVKNVTDQIEVDVSESELPGYERLMGIQELSDDIKKRLDLSNYFYEQKDENTELWIVGLMRYSFGFVQSRMVISYKDRVLRYMYLSYMYTEPIYVQNSFETYNGSVTVSNERLDYEHEFLYYGGRLIETAPTQIESNPVIFVNTPEPTVNWCLVFPPLCDYQGGEGGLDRSYTLLMMNPPDDGGGGGGGGTSGSFSTHNEPDPFITNDDPDTYWWDDNTTSFPTQNRPSWNDMNSNYPKNTAGTDDLPGPQVYSLVGGDVLALYNSNPSKYQNACALRVSRALNYSGVNIPYISGHTYAGADGKYYFLSSAKLYNWVRKTFGAPDVTLTGSQGGTNGQNFPSLLSGQKGIYIMVPNWPAQFGALGHATLFDGSSCVGGHCYYDAQGGVSRIYLWKLN